MNPRLTRIQSQLAYNSLTCSSLLASAPSTPAVPPHLPSFYKPWQLQAVVSHSVFAGNLLGNITKKKYTFLITESSLQPCVYAHLRSRLCVWEKSCTIFMWHISRSSHLKQDREGSSDSWGCPLASTCILSSHEPTLTYTNAHHTLISHETHAQNWCQGD